MMNSSTGSILYLMLVLVVWIRRSEGSAAGTETTVGIVGRDFVLLGADSSYSSRGGVAYTSSFVDKICVLFPGRVAVAASGDAADADRLLGLLEAHCRLVEYADGRLGDDIEYVNVNVDVDDVSEDVTVNVPSPPPSEGLDAYAVAHMARAEISKALRSGRPIRVCMLVAGMVSTRDDDGGDERNGERWSTTATLGSYTTRIRNQVQMANPSSDDIGENQANIAAATTTTTTTIDKKTTPTRTHRLRPSLTWMDEYGSRQRVEYGAHGYGSNFCLSILDRGYRPNMSRDEALALLTECFDQLKDRYVINAPRPPCIKCINQDGCTLLQPTRTQSLLSEED